MTTYARKKNKIRIPFALRTHAKKIKSKSFHNYARTQKEKNRSSSFESYPEKKILIGTCILKRSHFLPI